MTLLTKFANVLNSLSSLIFAVYAYLVLWGPIRLGSLTTISMIAPEQLWFSTAIWMLVVPAMLHVFFEVIGPLVRAPGNVFLYFCSVITSLFSIGVVGFALLLWVFRSYHASTFQEGALITFFVPMTVELITFGIGARLLQRSWFGEGAAHEHGH